MDSPTGTIPVHTSELEVGRALPWAVYDASGRMLLNEGVSPASQAQIDGMVERGLFRKVDQGRGNDGNGVRASPMHAASDDEDKRSLVGDPLPFDDLAMQPGEILHLRPALDMVAADVPALLIGYLKDRAIVVSTPFVAGNFMEAKAGTQFNAKTFSGTSLFSFRTRVLVSYTQPMPHLHLEYPKLVYATKIRKALRALVELPATVHDPASGNSVKVILKDLSVGGAKLVLSEPAGWAPNTQLSITFRVKIGDDIEEEVTATAVMRASETRQEKDRTVHTMGVQFKALTKSATLAIMALVYRQQLRKG